MQTPEKKRSWTTCTIVFLIGVLALFFLCSCFSFFSLSLIGGRGQPGTIVAPSEAAAGAESGSAVPIPHGLTATAIENSINLKWEKISAQNIKEYAVYRSDKPDQKYSKIATAQVGTPTYKDENVKKGITYYYVVTALTTGGAESGNSKRVSAIIDTPPLIPEGIYSWRDVKAKAEADPLYLQLFIKVTGLAKTDIDRLAQKEAQGQTFKTTLKSGTIVTNSTQDYKIIPNYVLKTDREALTDESGRPHVLMKCGNPMKLQAPVATTATVIQQVQVLVTNVIFVLPPQVTNIFINAGQAANSITVSVMPNSVIILVGADFAPLPPDVFVDPASIGEDDLYVPEADIELEEGQQWIHKGKLLVTADPADPAPGQAVTIIVKLFGAKEGVLISYGVQGTDGYSKSGQANTDQKGEISFFIPGAMEGVTDVINVSVPSEGLEGSVQYVF